ncbi:hypothetical protein VB780_11050 [Leptolyngbya sp. CCNP1308]|uniref:hypothetical protein n=1 Tax=Leptolyngbya sp. CCNP1308 TaxID=3110255 RepID=UPI002B2176E4|nr:hypothetical protein [Leptolyngbya sp. CCNP1308]MEA5449107.1 hypothetical protein [Leptolyngbya sp. CCNP1308]
MADQLMIYWAQSLAQEMFWDAMKLWLVCFLILFFGAEAAQWLGHLPWVSSVELSLPLTIAGGIGLAIASNYVALFGRNWPTFSSLPTKSADPSWPSPTAPPTPAVVAPIKSAKASRKADTISFEIKKP